MEIVGQDNGCAAISALIYMQYNRAATYLHFVFFAMLEYLDISLH